MARIKDALLPKGQSYGRGTTQPMVDVTRGGGTFGFAPDNVSWVSNQAYIRKNLFGILLEAPKFFTLMPQPEKFIGTLKALVELHPRSIEGLNSTLTVEFDEHPVGGAGETQQEFTDVKRSRSDPIIQVVEKYGLPFQTFLHTWITYGMADPETKYALIGTLAKDKRPQDMLADWYSATMLFIEPDPTHTKVVKAWLCTNMMPKGTGDIIGRRDLTAASEVLTLSVEFTALTTFSLGINTMAQKLLDEINLENSNPYLRPAFITKRDAEVTRANTGGGYEGNIQKLGKQALPGLSSEGGPEQNPTKTQLESNEYGNTSSA